MESKKIHYLLLLILVSLALSSCKTSDKVYIHAPVNTTLYLPSTPNTAHVRTYSNATEIEIPSVDYYGYMLAQDPATGLKMPFGLDVRKKRYTGEKFAVGTGYAVTSIGMATTLGGLIPLIVAACSDDEDASSVFATVTAIGAGVAGVGVAIGMPADSRLKQLSHQYQFTYVKDQNIEFPNLSTKLLHPDEPKGSSASTAKTKRGKATVAEQLKGQNAGSSTPASRSRGNKAKKISGTYKGTGKLLQDMEEVEFYQNVTINIKRVDSNKVKVSIIEGGEEFFSTPLIYNIINESKGKYTLALDKMPSETIVIDKTGKLIFKHNKVNIDNEIYTLLIDCKK